MRNANGNAVGGPGFSTASMPCGQLSGDYHSAPDPDRSSRFDLIIVLNRVGDRADSPSGLAMEIPRFPFDRIAFDPGRQVRSKYQTGRQVSANF
jgi:hypothetical protein